MNHLFQMLLGEEQRLRDVIARMKVEQNNRKLQSLSFTSPVQTTSGTFRGFQIPADVTLPQPIPQPVDVFYGIKYGTARRLFPASPWKGAGGDAITQPPLCLQKLMSDESIVGVEDCLYLNVYRPSSATPTSNLPVMVWIHGGFFQNGGSILVDGTAIASVENAIVVTINYRLGLLGFFLTQATPASGNLAMLDQRLALKWVRDNISNFGGNPSKVVIVGESSGAMSINWHLVSPGSAGLFSAAVVQSGTGATPAVFWSKSDAMLYFDWVSYSFFRCNVAQTAVVSCLSSIPASSFFIPVKTRFTSNAPAWATPLFPVIIAAPVIDGVDLLGSPEQLIASGKFAKVPLIIGSNLDEGSKFVYSLIQVMGPQFFPPAVSQLDAIWNFLTSTNVTQINSYYLSKYPGLDPISMGFTIANYQLRDLIFVCSVARMANSWVENGAHAYVYQIDLSPWSGAIKNIPPVLKLPLGSLNHTVPLSALGSYHTFEIPLLFKAFRSDSLLSYLAKGTPGFIQLVTNPSLLYMTTPVRQSGDIFHNVSDLMSCFWINLARCGSPSCTQCKVPANNWLPYTTGSAVNTMIFDGPLNQMGTVDTDACPLWVGHELAWRSFAIPTVLSTPVSVGGTYTSPLKLLCVSFVFMLLFNLIF